MELFHGPTLAFKDIALQLLGRLIDRALRRRGERTVIIGATSGDTGAAAIEACRGRDSMDIVILHPKGRVSAVQRRQMTTVAAANVHNIAIDGTFDDCQALVKAMFGDPRFRGEMQLTTINSINWARIAAQIVYYFHAALTLGAPAREIVFAVPSGNFGNVYSGYAARAMGLGIARLVVGSNRNDVLPRFFENGRLTLAEVVPTLSPTIGHPDAQQSRAPTIRAPRPQRHRSGGGHGPLPARRRAGGERAAARRGAHDFRRPSRRRCRDYRSDRRALS
jgi:threonine synthase